MTIAEEVRNFVFDNFLFGQANRALAEDTSFIERGIIDSTGVLELIAFVERRYGFRMDDDDIDPENLDSIRRIARYVERKLVACEAGVHTCA